MNNILSIIEEYVHINFFFDTVIKLDAPTAWGLYFQDSASPQIWSGKS